MSKPRLSRTDLAMLLVVLIWGANFTVVRVALERIPPLAFTAVRFVLAAAVLWLLLRLREGSARFPPGSTWRMVWLGIVGNTVYQTCFVLALTRTTVANVALLVATSPVLVALGGGLLRVERVTRPVAGGIGLAFVGTVLIVAGRGVSLSPATLRGDLLALGAAASWAVYTLGLRGLDRDVTPLRTTTLTTITGTPGLVLLAVPQLLELRVERVGAAGWAGLLYASLVSLVLAYFVWNSSVRAVGGSRTAVFLCATPIVAMLVAWPVLGEPPTAVQFAGAALIIAGLLLTRWEGRTARPAVEV